jgi:hypothetical protein
VSSRVHPVIDVSVSDIVGAVSDVAIPTTASRSDPAGGVNDPVVLTPVVVFQIIAWGVTVAIHRATRPKRNKSLETEPSQSGK